MFTPRRTALLLLIVTALLYAPTLTYGWVYEDTHDLQAWTQPFADASTIWMWKPARSLTQASFVLTYQLFGLWPGAYHAGNVLIHLVNGGLLYGVAASCLSPWAAVLALGVFLLHPVQVESVAYVSSRPDLVATTALLVGVWAVTARRWWLVGVACCLAFLAKETAVIAVPLCAWWGYWRGVRLPRPVIVAAALISVPCVAYAALSYPLVLDLKVALLSLTQFARLVALIVWPVGLAIEYDWNWITPIAMSATAGLWAAALVWVWYRQRTWLALTIGWCAIVIAPRLVVSLDEGLHTHHLLLVMPVVACLCGALVSAESERYGISASCA